MSICTLDQLHKNVAKAYTNAHTKLTLSKHEGKAEKLILKATSSTPNNAAELTAPELAVLSLIGTISLDDFWMTSDAGWHGPTSITKTLSAAKVSCSASSPPVQELTADFSTALANICWLQDQAATHGFTKKQCLLVGAPGTPDDSVRIKVKHALFKHIDQDDDTDEINSGDTENFPFTINIWPTYSKFAMAALDAMKDTYCVIPIPAYEKEGGLMYPSYYKHQLIGATVELHFTLTHWSISSKTGHADKNVDTYTAELFSMRVIRPPLPTIVSPHKQKVSTWDPLSLNMLPTKKGRQP